jgi:hypothetical protein
MEEQNNQRTMKDRLSLLELTRQHSQQLTGFAVGGHAQLLMVNVTVVRLFTMRTLSPSPLDHCPRAPEGEVTVTNTPKS